MSITENFSYDSRYNFDHGETYAMGENSKYLFTTTYKSDTNYSYIDLVKIDLKEIIYQIRDDEIEGYKRFFKKAGQYYYLVNIKRYQEYQASLVVQRMNFDPSPLFFLF